MKNVFFTFAALAVLATSAQAAVIWTNPITDSNPSAANPFTAGQTVASNMTVTGIGFGSGLTGNAGANRYNVKGFNSTALDANDYFTFTLDADSGFAINLTSFVYTGQLSSGSISFAFRSSLDNFATNIGTPATSGATIDLSGAQFQNLSSAVTFRLYIWGGTDAARTYSVNDFTFNGAVISAIPEPHEYGIAIATLLGTIIIVRRRQKSQVA